MVVDPYATHLPVLRALAAALPIQRVLEFGAGWHSTRAFLDRAIFPALEQLDSLEDDRVWFHDLREAIQDDRWSMLCFAGYHTAAQPRIGSYYNLILIDNGQVEADRVPIIASVSANRPAAVVVIHDWERLPYQQAAGFEHVHVFAEQTPWTAVCWNGSRPELEALTL